MMLINEYVRTLSKILRLTWDKSAEPEEVEDCARERCYNSTPYGRRYDVNSIGRDPVNYVMPMFTRANQIAHREHLDDTEGARGRIRSN